MSSQPPMRGHLAIPRNGILYTNEPHMCSHLCLKATFPVLQGWLLLAGSSVFHCQLTIMWSIVPFEIQKRWQLWSLHKYILHLKLT